MEFLHLLMWRRKQRRLRVEALMQGMPCADCGEGLAEQASGWFAKCDWRPFGRWPTTARRLAVDPTGVSQMIKDYDRDHWLTHHERLCLPCSQRSRPWQAPKSVTRRVERQAIAERWQIVTHEADPIGAYMVKFTCSRATAYRAKALAHALHEPKPCG